MGGGFFQSLKASLLLLDIKKFESKFELIITHKKTKTYLEKKNIKNKLFRLGKLYNYLSQLFEIDFFRDLWSPYSKWSKPSTLGPNPSVIFFDPLA